MPIDAILDKSVTREIDKQTRKQAYIGLPCPLLFPSHFYFFPITLNGPIYSLSFLASPGVTVGSLVVLELSELSSELSLEREISSNDFSGMLDETSQGKPSSLSDSNSFSGGSLSSAAPRNAVTIFKDHCISRMLISEGGRLVESCVLSVVTSPK